MGAGRDFCGCWVGFWCGAWVHAALWLVGLNTGYFYKLGIALILKGTQAQLKVEIGEAWVEAKNNFTVILLRLIYGYLI